MIPALDDWQPWSPERITERLKDVHVPWYVAGGWAVDLHLGETTREHEDLEVAVPRDRFATIAGCFPELAFFVPGNGRVVPATPEALDADPEEFHQAWALDPVADAWRFDVFREPHDGDVWVSRRNPGLRRPYGQLIRHTPGGVPYLAPEVTLLFKAKHRRDKDEADYALLSPRLTAGERAWLNDALELVHPGHPWITPQQ